jgi:protein-tyrosine phosphatase
MSYSIENVAKLSSIVDNLLYLGSQASTNNEALVTYNIQNVISIGCNPICYNPIVKIFKYDIEDNSDSDNLYKFFNQTIPNIHNIINECIDKKEPILVHCQAGMSRSAAVIITWLMFYKNITYEEAYKYVKERRPVITPNATFVDYMKTIKI